MAVEPLRFSGPSAQLSRSMKLPGVPYTPKYTTDEKVFGVVVALALHLLAIVPFVYRGCVPAGKDADEDKELVARPVVQASILKLGKPIDPKKLPDRLVPQQRTAPKKTLTASKEDPAKVKPDAGAPPEHVADSDILNLVSKSDPFAEDAGKRRPEEGHELGVDGGNETDPNKVHAGDMYALKLGQFFGENLTIPSIISGGEARKLCARFQIRLNAKMVIWYVKQQPVKSSGNPLFDDAAREMLLKLSDQSKRLPEPPPEVEGKYRGQILEIQIPGDPQGASACK
jgi:hypothetical protein